MIFSGLKNNFRFLSESTFLYIPLLQQTINYTMQKTSRIAIRLTDQEKKQLFRIAKKNKTSVSEYIRSLIIMDVFKKQSVIG